VVDAEGEKLHVALHVDWALSLVPSRSESIPAERVLETGELKTTRPAAVIVRAKGLMAAEHGTEPAPAFKV
jgi:hypothetical protein